MRTTILVAVAALLFCGAASAKGPATVRVCGPDACALLDQRDLAARVAMPQETVDPPSTAPHYRLDVDFGGTGNAYSTLFVPSEGLIATNAGGLLWYAPRGDVLRALRSVSADVAAFDAPPAWPRWIERPAAVPATETGGAGAPTRLLTAGGLLVLGAGFAAISRQRARRPRPA